MTPPVIDAHHHIWRQADQPWMQGPTVPRIFGDYSAIKRDYPIEEFLQDIAGTGVEKSVYVQTNWAPERAVEEVEWVTATAQRTGWPHAIVSFVDLHSDMAAAVMEKQARSSLMRGVRQQLHWHVNPQYRFAPAPDMMNRPAFRKNLAALADRGWLFELQVFAPQMADGAALAAALPNVTFVLEHAGMLEDLTPAGRRAWRDGMRRLADQPNMHTKLSALGTFIRRNDTSHIAEVVQETVEIFGPERCLWGSNFPIENIWTDYPSVLNAAKAAIASFDEGARDAILRGTAARLYRLG
jgi:predicted TIM-barrel fold metal-dependent hydrolase